VKEETQVKITCNYNTRKEQSSSNSATVPAISCQNKDLLEYLNSEKYKEDFQKAKEEKEEK